MRVDRDRGLMAVRPASTSWNRSDRDNDALDFRACQDDAWYAVRLSLLQIKGEGEGEGKGDGDTILNVAYTDLEGGDFPDERFSASQFSSLEDLVVFASRFRPTSIQLQDDQCSDLTRGMLVSACHPFEPDQLLFYDALVESVEYKAHRFHAETGEKECCCTFLLLWQHGPLQGTLSHRGVADICLLKPASQFPPALASFLSIARRHLQQCHPSSDRVLRRFLPDLVSVSPGPAYSKPSIVPFKEPLPGYHTYPTIWNPSCHKLIYNGRLQVYGSNRQAKEAKEVQKRSKGVLDQKGAIGAIAPWCADCTCNSPFCECCTAFYSVVRSHCSELGDPIRF